MKLSTNSSAKTASPKSILKDIFVVIICICGIGGSLFFFYKAINRSLQNTGSESVATITFKYRTAQRRFENRLVWEWLQNNAEIYNGDHIRTGGLSEAVLHFEDETVIKLDEKTLIQVKVDQEQSLLPVFMRREKKPAEKKTGQAVQTAKTVAKPESKSQVTVTSGAITLDTAASSSESTVSIIAGNHKINAAQNTQAVLSVKDDIVEVQTVTGQVEIEKLPAENQPGQTEAAVNESKIIITEGNKASIDKASSNVVVSTITITEPVNNSYYLLAGKDELSVGFNYVSDNEAGSNLAEAEKIDAMLEISSKEDFSELYTYLNLNVSGSGVYNVMLPEGRWNWRLNQKNAEGRLSETTNGAFTVYKVNKPEIFLPEQNEVFTAEYDEASSEEKATAKVMLSWKNDRRAIKYLVNAECKQNGKTVSFYSEVSTFMTELPYYLPASNSEEAEPQKWTWTVTPIFMESWKGESVSSIPAVFYVMPPKKKAVVEEPELSQTENKEDDEELEEIEDEEALNEVEEEAEAQAEAEREAARLAEEQKAEEERLAALKVEEEKKKQEELQKTKAAEAEKTKKPAAQTNEDEQSVKFEEEIFVASLPEKTTVAAPEFKVTVANDETEIALQQEGKTIIATEFSEKSRWRTRTDKSAGGTSTASCDQIIVDYDGKAYSGIKFESQINASTAKKLSSTLFMNSIQLPDSLQGSKGLIFKVIGDGNDYTLRIGVGNIEYGCKLKTKAGEVLLFDINYSVFRQQTGSELVPLDSDEITGITLSPSVPFPGKYEITIFDMNAK